MNPTEEFNCRICLEDNLRRVDVISPCACAGGSKWVHRDCLDQWRTMREDRAFSRCTECLIDYKLIPRLEEESASQQRKRKAKYALLMGRDLGGMFFLVQAIITILGVITYECDKRNSALIFQFDMEAHPRLFYYLCGLVFFSAIAGAIGTVWLTCFNESNNRRNSTNTCHGCYCYGPSGGGDCCAGCSCDGCTAGGGSADCGEAGPLIIIILVAFAIIGAIIIVMAGVVFVQQVMRNHANVLYKKEMAQEYLVADLASPDHGIGVLNTVAREAAAAAAAAAGGGGGGLAGEDANNTKTTLSQTYSSIAPMVRSASNSSSSSNESDAVSAPAIVSDSCDQHMQQMDRLDEEIGLVSIGSSSSSGGVSPSAPELSHAQRKELAKYGLI